MCTLGTMMTRDRRPFTLLEVILTCALLALIGAVCLYQGKDMISNYAAASDIKTLKEHIAFTRHLSLSYKTMMSLELINTDKGVVLRRHTNETLLGKERHFAPYQITCPYLVKGVFPEKSYTLTFDHLGVVTPNQDIVFKTKHQDACITIQIKT